MPQPLPDVTLTAARHAQMLRAEMAIRQLVNCLVVHGHAAHGITAHHAVELVQFLLARQKENVA